MIFAGYKDRMETFYSSSGLSSRVAHHLDFRLQRQRTGDRWTVEAQHHRFSAEASECLWSTSLVDAAAVFANARSIRCD